MIPTIIYSMLAGVLLYVVCKFIVIGYLNREKPENAPFLQDEEEYLRLAAIFDNVSLAMLLVDNKMEVLKFNKASTQIGLCKSVDSIEGKHAYTLNCAAISQQQCGLGRDCTKCTFKASVLSTLENRAGVQKVPFIMNIKSDESVDQVHLMISTIYLEIKGLPLVLLSCEDVTSAAKVESALVESEFRHKQIKRAITDYIYTVVIHENGDIQTIHSLPCFYITGYKAEEFDANPRLWFDIIEDEDRERVIKFIQDMPSAKHSQGIEHRIINKEGQERWISNILVRKKTKGTTIFYSGVIRDITARKNIELALNESEQKLSVIFEYSPVGISLCDPNGNIQYLNPAFCRLLDYKPDQNSENSLNLFHNSEGNAVEIELFNKLRKGELNLLNFEKQIFKNGSERELFVQMQVSCFKNSKGEVANYIAVVEDITDRKKALVLLQSSEEKFRNIFNTSNDAILITDFESRIYEANQNAISRSGLQFEQLKNKKLLDLFIAANDKEHVRKQFVKLSENETAFFQSNYTNRHGEKVYIDVVGHSISYDGKQLVLLISRDITERVISQQHIMNAIIEAEEKERSAFSQELHDGLGPILSTIKLYLECIQNPEAKSDKSALVTDALHTLEDAISSVKEISNKLSPNVLTKLGLGMAIHSFIKKLESIGNVNFSVNINLPNRIRPEIEAMLYRVFVEAINNSLKYANATNIFIFIEITPDALSATFRDDGAGFDLEEILNQKKGHGLFNMQNRVETYEGVFSLKSKQGEGTEIYITIPTNKYMLLAKK